MVFTRCPCLLSNCAWTAVLSLLDASWSSTWSLLERLGQLLDVFGAELGCSWTPLGRSGTPLGRLLGKLGRLLGKLGRLLDASWASWTPVARLLHASWTPLGPLGPTWTPLGLCGCPLRLPASSHCMHHLGSAWALEEALWAPLGTVIKNCPDALQDVM